MPRRGQQPLPPTVSAPDHARPRTIEDVTDEKKAPAEPEWKRRQRLAAIFGDVLPDATADNRDLEDPRSSRDNEEWLKRQVPPHHGGN